MNKSIKLNDTVWVNGIKGRVIKVFKPLGTFDLFKVKLEDGEIIERAKFHLDQTDPLGDRSTMAGGCPCHKDYLHNILNLSVTLYMQILFTY
jgi:hypothetical protein